MGRELCNPLEPTPPLPSPKAPPDLHYMPNQRGTKPSEAYPAPEKPATSAPVAQQPSAPPRPSPQPPGSPYAQAMIMQIKMVQLNQFYRQSGARITKVFNDSYMSGREPIPEKGIPNEVVQKLQDADMNFTVGYFTERSNLQKLHDDAVAYMNLSPNQKAEDEKQFNAADAQARQSTPVPTLQSGHLNTDRFAAMITYLDGLVTKLADYPVRPQ